MEILINELSLTGQFKDDNKFLDNFDKILKIIKIIDVLGFTLLKEYSFFQAKVTTTFKLDDFLRLRTDRARRMKRFLSKLTYNPPYWNDDQKHNCSKNSYLYHHDNVCNTSLAESCERDKTILSFTHNNFLKTDLEILKDGNPVSVYNFINKSSFLNHLLSISQIEPLDYCQHKFKNSNLNFSNIENKYGFDLLNTTQQIDEFITSFKDFSQKSWNDIIKSSANKKGLNYKAYDGNWFKNTQYSHLNIFKFRVTQKYRCFGYREKDEFFVLRFEIDHKISDNG
jgi:hypothetical protein